MQRIRDFILIVFSAAVIISGVNGGGKEAGVKPKASAMQLSLNYKP
jgi:hypothetical protein